MGGEGGFLWITLFKECTVSNFVAYDTMPQDMNLVPKTSLLQHILLYCQNQATEPFSVWTCQTRQYRPLSIAVKNFEAAETACPKYEAQRVNHYHKIM